MGNAVEINEVVRALACYLRLNPHASDTTEGIRLWWFDRESEVAVDLLLPALAWMVEHRFVETMPALDGHLRYRRTASDLQIDALLQGRSGA